MRQLALFIVTLLALIPLAAALQVTSATLGAVGAIPGSDVNTTFTITNNEPDNLINVQVASSADSKYTIQFQNTPLNLSVGESRTVTVKGKIPLDFSGSQKIGTISVTATRAPQTQGPQQITSPVAISATDDCGAFQDPLQTSSTYDRVGGWHVGQCGDSVTAMELSQFNTTLDAGWLHVYVKKDNTSNVWVRPVSYGCGVSGGQNPPSGFTFGGRILAGPAECDGYPEVTGGDTGWVGMYTNPSVGKLALVIIENSCGGQVEQTPQGGMLLGKVRTGKGVCDGQAEAYSHANTALDSGIMGIFFIPAAAQPSQSPGVGVFESLSWTGFSGWAYDPDAPMTSLNIYVDGQHWKMIDANVPRPDLVTAGTIPNPNHGFNYTFTQADLASALLANTSSHTIAIKAVDIPSGQQIELTGSPKTLPALVSGGTQTNQTNTTNTTQTNTTQTNTTTQASVVVTASSDLNMQAGDVLRFDRVKIQCDKLETISYGDTVELAPGKTCTVIVRIENAANDLDLEDVILDMEADDSDIEGDSVRISSLDSGDKEEKELVLEIDKGIDEGKFKVTIEAQGEDERGRAHKKTFTFTIEIEKPKHNLAITRILVSPEEANRCFDDRVTVTVYVENEGARDEDQASVELEVPALKFSQKLRDLEIEEGEEQRFTFSIPISKSTSFGSFIATAKAFYDNTAQTSAQTATVKVVKCADENVVVVEPPKQAAPPQPVNDIVVVEPLQEENDLTGVYAVILTVLNIVAVSVLGVMAYNMTIGKRKKPEDYY